MIGFRAKFPVYKEFAEATMDKILSKEELKDALIYKANFFSSAFIRNLGNGKFEIKALPIQAQWSPIDAILVEDFDDDGNLDIVINANDYGTEVSVGRYDASNGLFLKGDGTGGFQSIPMSQSGIYIPGDGKALIRFLGANNGYRIAASQNRGPIKFYALRSQGNLYRLSQDDQSIFYQLKNGKTRKEELYFGNSFLSQSSRFIRFNQSILSAEVTNGKNQKRKLSGDLLRANP
jgi:hypothetical protein